MCAHVIVACDDSEHNDTLNSTYNEVTFNEKLPITKENLSTKYTPFTYKYIALNEKLPITKQNLCIFFFIIGGVECIVIYIMILNLMIFIMILIDIMIMIVQ